MKYSDKEVSGHHLGPTMKHKNKRKTGRETSLKNLFRQHYNQNYRTNKSNPRAARNTTYWREFQKARIQSTPDSLVELYALVEENPKYPFSGLGNSFPLENRRFVDARIKDLTPLNLEKEVSIQVARINHYSDRIISALTSLSEINALVSAGRCELAQMLIDQHKSVFGPSICILKKELLCSLEIGSHTALSKKLKELVLGNENSAYSLINRFLYDFLDPTNDPARASRYWTDVSQQRPGVDWWTKVIESSLYVCPVSKVALSNALLRLNAVCLLDLVICLWRACNLQPSWPELKNALDALDNNIRFILQEQFSSISLTVPKSYTVGAGSIADKTIYRLAFIFDEYANVFTPLADIQILSSQEALSNRNFDFRWLNARPIASVTNAINATENIGISELPDDNLFSMPFLTSDVEIKNTNFFYSIAAAEILRSSISNLSEDAVVTILTHSSELQFYLSRQTIRTLRGAGVSQGSPLLQFLFSELQFRKSRSGDDELERRLCFMQMFPGGNRESILEFVKQQHLNAPRLARQIATLCNRRFLEKLFLLMSSVKED